MTQQTITRKGSFDSGHRVMNERMKCFNLHGHTYLYELTFLFSAIEDIGYAMDFKEIKRVGCQWIDDVLDHGTIVNPHDAAIIKACEETGSKIWFMSLNGDGEYCNPSVENIAKEVFLGVSYLMDNATLKLASVRIHETPNCFTDCIRESISTFERINFLRRNEEDLKKYKKEKGFMEYDDRKI